MSNYDNEEIIDLWTSKFLREFARPIPERVRPVSRVAFGRTYVEADQTQSLCPRNALSPLTASNDPRSSLCMGTKLSDSRAYLNQKQRMLLSKPVMGQESKFRGRQIYTFKIDLSKAREKRIRQLQYSREIESGAKTLVGREIDSITRIVVQSFRKLIDCERCALFLMDESTNELYFKPVGDVDHSHARLKEIRFPSSSGVAGWVASNKKMLHIKNGERNNRKTLRAFSLKVHLTTDDVHSIPRSSFQP